MPNSEARKCECHPEYFWHKMYTLDNGDVVARAHVHPTGKFDGKDPLANFRFTAKEWESMKRAESD